MKKLRNHCETQGCAGLTKAIDLTYITIAPRDLSWLSGANRMTKLRDRHFFVKAG